MCTAVRKVEASDTSTWPNSQADPSQQRKDDEEKSFREMFALWKIIIVEFVLMAFCVWDWGQLRAQGEGGRGTMKKFEWEGENKRESGKVAAADRGKIPFPTK